MPIAPSLIPARRCRVAVCRLRAGHRGGHLCDEGAAQAAARTHSTACDAGAGAADPAAAARGPAWAWTLGTHADAYSLARLERYSRSGVLRGSGRPPAVTRL